MEHTLKGAVVLNKGMRFMPRFSPLSIGKGHEKNARKKGAVVLNKGMRFMPRFSPLSIGKGHEKNARKSTDVCSE